MQPMTLEFSLGNLSQQEAFTVSMFQHWKNQLHDGDHDSVVRNCVSLLSGNLPNLIKVAGITSCNQAIFRGTISEITSLELGLGRLCSKIQPLCYVPILPTTGY